MPSLWLIGRVPKVNNMKNIDDLLARQRELTAELRGINQILAELAEEEQAAKRAKVHTEFLLDKERHDQAMAEVQAARDEEWRTEQITKKPGPIWKRRQ